MKTDGTVAAVFAARGTAEVEAGLIEAETAFASVNDMASLSRHPHLRRIRVRTAAGEVSLPAPGPIFIGEERVYGPVPDVDEHGDLPV